MIKKIEELNEEELRFTRRSLSIYLRDSKRDRLKARENYFTAATNLEKLEKKKSKLTKKIDRKNKLVNFLNKVNLKYDLTEDFSVLYSDLNKMDYSITCLHKAMDNSQKYLNMRKKISEIVKGK